MGALISRVAVVNGAGGELGNAISKTLAQAGADLALLDFEAGAGMEKLTKEILGMGRKCVALGGDLTRQEEVGKFIREAVDKIGKPGILVNNGPGTLGTPGRAEELAEEDWDRVIQCNLTAAFLCCQAVLPYMEEEERGSIINISSSAARGWSDFSGPQYVAAKSALIGLARHLAREYGPKGIRVNALAQGFTETQEAERRWRAKTDRERDDVLRQIPLRRRASTQEHAQVVLFLASEDSSYITAATLDVSGGMFTI